jgi:hypothetical protein
MKCISFLALLIMTSTALAGSTRVQSRVNYANPNGCRAFDHVVDPSCPYELTPVECADGLKMVQELAAQLKLESLKPQCSRLHTGNVLARLAEETAEQSASWDGYTLSAKMDSSEASGAGEASLDADNAEECQKVATLLKGLELQASCDNLRVSVSR